MASIRLHEVSKAFGKTAVIRGLSLDIADGELCVFVGPSGCGKSTLLRLLAGLEEVSSGELFIGDTNVTDVAPAKRGVAIVFQSYALYPHLNVYDNMAFGLKLAKHSRAEVRRRIDEAARLLQIDALLDRLPKQLSGGQRQRVAIGRAITREPKVFLFDEPLSNLDASLRVQTRIEIANLHRRLATTMVYVTHDQVEAMTLADKIVVLNHGEIEQVGAPLELYHHPANLFVAGFIGSPRMNLLPATLRAQTAAATTVELAEGRALQLAPRARELPRGAEVTVGIRPEHLQATQVDPATTTGAALRGTVRAVERLGESSYLYVASEATQALVTVKVPGDAALAIGDEVGLEVAPKRCHLFDADGDAVPALAQ